MRQQPQYTAHPERGNQMKDINETMGELAEMTAMLEETKAIIEGLQEEVKAYMTAKGVDEVLTDTAKRQPGVKLFPTVLILHHSRKISRTSTKNTQGKLLISVLRLRHE